MKQLDNEVALLEQFNNTSELLLQNYQKRFRKVEVRNIGVERLSRSASNSSKDNFALQYRGPSTSTNKLNSLGLVRKSGVERTYASSNDVSLINHSLNNDKVSRMKSSSWNEGHRSIARNGSSASLSYLKKSESIQKQLNIIKQQHLSNTKQFQKLQQDRSNNSLPSLLSSKDKKLVRSHSICAMKTLNSSLHNIAKSQQRVSNLKQSKELHKDRSNKSLPCLDSSKDKKLTRSHSMYVSNSLQSSTLQSKRVSFTGRVLSDQEMKLRAELREIRNSSFPGPKKNNNQSKKSITRSHCDLPSLFQDNHRFQMEGGLITIADDFSERKQRRWNNFSTFTNSSNANFSAMNKLKRETSFSSLAKEKNRFQKVNGLITLTR